MYKITIEQDCRQVYVQVVEHVDVLAVIQAVNKQDETVHIKFDHGRVFDMEKRA